MNNLSQSNIAQLCSIVVCDLFAIYIGNRLYHNKDYGRESWNDFPEMCKRKCLFQSTLSLVWPTSKKVKAEWTILIESTAERLAKATIETFLLGIREDEATDSISLEEYNELDEYVSACAAQEPPHGQILSDHKQILWES